MHVFTPQSATILLSRVTKAQTQHHTRASSVVRWPPSVPYGTARAARKIRLNINLSMNHNYENQIKSNQRIKSQSRAWTIIPHHSQNIGLPNFTSRKPFSHQIMAGELFMAWLRLLCLVCNARGYIQCRLSALLVEHTLVSCSETRNGRKRAPLESLGDRCSVVRIFLFA
jgi:hypothetical protein